MTYAPHVVDAYASQVVAGELPAGKYHRLACVRHQRDRAREATPAFPFRFVPELADRFYRFAEKQKHYKGRQWAGRLIQLSDCQKFRLGSLFGWVHVTTGLRRFRTAYNELPRKQGKSLEAACVATYVTFFDGEAGAEGYTAATKRDQARIVFNDAKKLVSTNAGLQARIGVHAANLHHVASSSKLEPLSADYNSMDGLNPQLVVLDEFHALKDRGTIDVLETAMGARLQPVMFQITTAGDDELSPCGEQHHYACQILEGALEDDTFFAFIAHADEADDPFAETTWQKANPHYGLSVNPADMRALATKAQHMPSAAAAFKQKRLNLWVNASSPWLDLEQWKAGQSVWEPELLVGRPCFGGLDLSSKTDLSAFVLVFPPIPTDDRWRLLAWFFTPADGIEKRARQARAPYQRWIEQKYLITNPGNRIDHAVIKATIAAAHAQYPIQLLGYDPWNIGNLATELQEILGEDRVIEVPQNMAQMSEPSKEWEAEVGAARIDAGGHPILLWNMSNVVVIVDAKENIFPTKKKSRGRIDGGVAGIVGLKLARLGETKQDAASRYFEQYGLLGTP